MATGILRNFLQAPNPTYYPMTFRCSPCHKNEDETMVTKSDGRENQEERDEWEDEEECEAKEDEEECLNGFLSNPGHSVLDVTSQLLRFAEIISRDVQRYFGRCSDDRDACDIYSDSVSTTTSGRLRYYDDLIKIAKAGSPEEQDSSSVSRTDDEEPSGSLGPLAELFDHRSLSQGGGQPMIKRHLPPSFWSEPAACCSSTAFGRTPEITHAAGGVFSQENTQPSGCRHLTQQHTHTIHSPQLDFSDLLADWDSHPEFNSTLSEDTHTCSIEQT